MPNLTPEEALELEQALAKACCVVAMLITAVCGGLSYVATENDAPWAVGVIMTCCCALSGFSTHKLNVLLLHVRPGNSSTHNSFRRLSSANTAHGGRRRTTLVDNLSCIMREVNNPLVRVQSAVQLRIPETPQQRRENSFRGRPSFNLMVSNASVVAVKGFERYDVANLDTSSLGQDMTIAHETLTDLCAVNEGTLLHMTGGTFFLAFSSVSNALRAAVAATKIPDAQDLRYTFTSGVVTGTFVKGSFGAHKVVGVALSGSVSTAERLACACEPFQCETLYAGYEARVNRDAFRFHQVDIVNFGTSSFPVYSVGDGSSRDDEDIAIVWLHIREKDLVKGLQLLEKVVSVFPDIIAAQARVGHVLRQLLHERRDMYLVNMQLGTAPAVVNMDVSVKRVGAIMNKRKSRSLEMGFLAMQLGDIITDLIVLREVIVKFQAVVTRHGGFPEHSQSGRFIGRWTINHGYRDLCQCLAVIMTTFTAEKYGVPVGFGVAAGAARLVQILEVDYVCSIARARAETHAMMSVTHGMGGVVDTPIRVQVSPNESTFVHSVGVDDPSLTWTCYWRPVVYTGTYKLPYESQCAGLAELGSIEPHNLYLHAMKEISKKSWNNAKEFLQKYNDVGAGDTWSLSLQGAVTLAVTEEGQGIRASDDDLILVLDMSGANFESSTKDLDFGGTSKILQDNIHNLKMPTEGYRRNAQVNARDNIDEAMAEPEAVVMGHGLATDRRLIRKLLGFHGQDNQSKKAEFRFKLAEFWNIIKLVAILFDCFISVARMNVTPTGYTADTIAFLLLGYFCDASYAVDIVLNFREPVTNDRGIRITSHQDIATLYVRGWFAIDIIGCVPWELFWVFFDLNFLGKHTWLRFNRMANIARLPGLTSCVVDTITEEESPLITRIFTNLGILVYLLFWCGVACSLALGVETDIQDNPHHYGYGWPSNDAYFRVEGYTNLSPTLKNLIGFHWAIRGFAGYGQPWPMTDLETMMCILLVVFGIAIFATVIAYLQSAMKMTHNEVFLNRLDMIVAVAEHRRLDEETTADILKYHRMLWSKTKQVYEGQFDDLKSELPEELIGELSYFVNIRAAERLHILQSSASAQFVTHLVSKLSLRFGAPGEVILERGDAFDVAKSGVYFIFKGIAIAAVEDVEVEVIESFWGEISCLLGVPQPADLVLTTYCEMYYLTAFDFRNLLTAFPDYIGPFVAAAAMRREVIKSIVQDADYMDADPQEARQDDEVSQHNSFISRSQYTSFVKTSFTDAAVKMKRASNAESSLSPSVRSPSIRSPSIFSNTLSGPVSHLTRPSQASLFSHDSFRSWASSSAMTGRSVKSMMSRRARRSEEHVLRPRIRRSQDENAEKQIPYTPSNDNEGNQVRPETDAE